MSTTRATLWSVTINNPIPADDENIALARQKGWTVTGQPEKGAQGTPHYQLAVRTPQIRFSQVKKSFPRAHIEVAKNPAALLSYVVKEETRSGSLPVQQSRYPSLVKYWDLIFAEIKYARSCDDDNLGLENMSQQNRLILLDNATSRLIEAGYFVESIATNPNVRSSFAKFAPALMKRAYVDRQTDRQANLFFQPNGTNADQEEDASLPQEADATPRWNEETGGDQVSLPRHEVYEGDCS